MNAGAGAAGRAGIAGWRHAGSQSAHVHRVERHVGAARLGQQIPEPPLEVDLREPRGLHVAEVRIDVVTLAGAHLQLARGTDADGGDVRAARTSEPGHIAPARDPAFRHEQDVLAFVAQILQPRHQLLQARGGLILAIERDQAGRPHNSSLLSVASSGTVARRPRSPQSQYFLSSLSTVSVRRPNVSVVHGHARRHHGEQIVRPDGARQEVDRRLCRVVGPADRGVKHVEIHHEHPVVRIGRLHARRRPRSWDREAPHPACSVRCG